MWKPSLTQPQNHTLSWCFDRKIWALGRRAGSRRLLLTRDPSIRWVLRTQASLLFISELLLISWLSVHWRADFEQNCGILCPVCHSYASPCMQTHSANGYSVSAHSLGSYIVDFAHFDVSARQHPDRLCPSVVPGLESVHRTPKRCWYSVVQNLGSLQAWRVLFMTTRRVKIFWTDFAFHSSSRACLAQETRPLIRHGGRCLLQ